MSLRKAMAEVMEAAVRRRVFPGGVVGYVRSEEFRVWPFGRFGYEPDAPLVQADTIYDVASITKSIPTAAVALRLIEEGHLGLEDRVIAYLPELDNPYREHIRVKHLLTYTVALDLAKGPSAQVREGLDATGVLGLAYATPLKTAPGTVYAYSNVPALWLGQIVERVSGQPLDVVAESMFFGPLGMKHTTFHPEALTLAQIAPTEVDWRGEVHGQIHDEMAWILRREGHVAGHAGLFSTAGDLLLFARMLLDKGEYKGQRYLQPQTVRQMHTNQIAALGQSAGLGWELDQRRFMGEKASPETFGKTGFTGCLILVDPVKEAAMVLLSNRTYPRRPESPEAINAVRRQLADLVFAD